MKQQTIATSIYAKGKGRLTGETIRFSLNPAPENTGIVIRRIDVRPTVLLRTGINGSLLKHALSGDRDFDSNSFRFLLAVLYALQIDNVRVDVEGPEFPHMNNVATNFLFLVQSAGVKIQRQTRRMLQIVQPVNFSHNGQWVKLMPCDRLRLTCMDPMLDKELPVHNVGTMMDFSKATFLSEIGNARCSTEIKSQWRNLNFSLRMSKADLNRKLRLEQELTYRKFLNVIADLAFVGLPMNANYISCNADTVINMKLLATLNENKNAWYVQGVPPTLTIAAETQPVEEELKQASSM